MRAMVFLMVGASVLSATPVFAADQRCAGDVDFFQPTDGVIGNSHAAQTIALAYLVPIYGKSTIRGELPLKAILKDGIWTVNGTLPAQRAGGTAQIMLCQRNGRVLRITHYK